MFTISNICDGLQFQPFVANRIWEAWWKSGGHSAEEIANAVSKIAAAKDFPFALVAHRDNEYWGHVLGIEADLDSRPDLTPWLAALWVDPAYRRKGVASRLLHAAEEQFAKIGNSKIFLCANDVKTNFYATRGWQFIATDTNQADLGIFQKTIKFSNS